MKTIDKFPNSLNNFISGAFSFNPCFSERSYLALSKSGLRPLWKTLLGSVKVCHIKGVLLYITSTYFYDERIRKSPCTSTRDLKFLSEEKKKSQGSNYAWKPWSNIKEWPFFSGGFKSGILL